jgi:GAF domain-containing protein
VSYRGALWTMGATVGTLALFGTGFIRQFKRRLGENDSAQAANLMRLNGYYRALSHTNQLIVRQRDDDEAGLLQEICRICVENGHALLACVFMLEPDGTARRAACVGPAAALFGGLPEPWRPDAKSSRQSVTARALLDGTVAISQDYQHEAPSARWRDRAAEVGVQSVASFPLRRGGKPVGALSLYASELAYFDAPLLKLLEEMAADVSFALDNIDRERARAAAHRATEESLRNFKAVFQTAPVSAAVADIHTGIVLWQTTNSANAMA